MQASQKDLVIVLVIPTLYVYETLIYLSVVSDALDMTQNVHFSRKSDEWGTPQELFDSYNKEFEFDCDVASTKENAKCNWFYTEQDNSLEQVWGHRNWCNPPYSKVKEFAAKASEEQKKRKLTVMLIPARTDTRFFHDYCYEKKDVEIRFIKGRIKFVHPDGALLRGSKMNGSNNAAPFPSMLVIFHPKDS